jgi:hypothetical protein
MGEFEVRTLARGTTRTLSRLVFCPPVKPTHSRISGPGDDGVRGCSDNSGVGFIADPTDLLSEPPKVELDDDELDFLDGVDRNDNEDCEDDVQAVERAPRRASSGAPREGAGPRSRTTSIAVGAAGLFADEPGGFAFGGSYERGTVGRPVLMSSIGRARVIELLEEAAGGLALERMRPLMRRGRRTMAASEDYARLAAAIASLRARRRIRVDHLAEVLGCDPATIWRLTIRGRSQLQDSQDPYVGTGAQQMAA